MIDQLPKKYGSRIKKIVQNKATGKLIVWLKPGWFVKTQGQHMLIEDDMQQLIAAMHLHTFRCECDFCEFWATTGLS